MTVGGDPATALDRAGDILRVEQALGLHVEQGVQAALNGFGTLTTFANWIYIWGHWPAIAATSLWLALHHRVVFGRLRDAMVVSGLMGLCACITHPVAPPRLSGLGMIGTDPRSNRSHVAGVHEADSTAPTGQAQSRVVAART